VVHPSNPVIGATTASAVVTQPHRVPEPDLSTKWCCSRCGLRPPTATWSGRR
jgi:hypothetical protein